MAAYDFTPCMEANDIPADEQAFLFAAIAREENPVPAGAAVFSAGDPVRGFFFVDRGHVRLSRVSRKGRETTLFTAGPGETFAEASLFSDAYHCDAFAATDAIVRCMPKAAALAVLQKDDNVNRRFMAQMARQIMSLRTRVALRDIRNAGERVLAFLEVIAPADGRTVNLCGRSLKSVGAEIGLTPEALYRALARLEAAGAIERRENGIRLVDRT